MEPTTRPGLEKRIFWGVLMTACSILVAGTILSVWSSKEARTSLSRMFNDQQLISARYAAGLIEHQLAFIRKKLVFLRSDIVLNAGDPVLVDQTIQNGLSRIMENGVRKFEIIDPHAHITSVHLPYGRRGEKTWTSESVNRLPLPQSIEAGDIWSEPYIANPGIPMLAMITSLNDRAGRFLVCHIFQSVKTRINLVVNDDRMSFAEALRIKEKLQEINLRIHTVVVNKIMHGSIPETIAETFNEQHITLFPLAKDCLMGYTAIVNYVIANPASFQGNA
jgi:hypothetical protein